MFLSLIIYINKVYKKCYPDFTNSSSLTAVIKSFKTDSITLFLLARFSTNNAPSKKNFKILNNSFIEIQIYLIEFVNIPF